MKIVKIFIVFVILSAVIGIGSAFTCNLIQVNEFDNDNVLKENEKDTEDIEIIEEKINDEEKEIIIGNKTDNKTPKVKDNNVAKKITNDSKEESNKKQEPKQKQELEAKQKNTKEIITEPKDTKKPWEELGISENDYYSKPMWSWMKIDFSINDYSSQSATEKACREFGNKKAEEEGLGFSCTNVLSYSGNYLGEYIKFF